MESAGLSLFTHRLHLRDPWTLSRGTAEDKHYAFLRRERDGIISWGEAAHNARYGESLEGVTAALTSYLRNPSALPTWKTTAPKSAAACMDILEWDERAQLAGVTVGSLLGSSATAPPPTSFSIGLDEPESMQRKLLAAPGFAVYKIKLGTARDREIISALREVTAAPLRVDANEGWKSPEEALDHIFWLAERNVELVEQPLPAGRLREMAWLKSRSPLPLVADEDLSDVSGLDLLADAYHGINCKLMKLGGITPVRGIMERARHLGLSIMLGCMIETSVGIAAAAHLSSEADWVDLDGHLLLADDPFTGLRIEEGRVLTNDRPGLGLDWALPHHPWES